MNLYEGLFGNYRVLSTLNGKDITEMVYLHFLALQILHSEDRFSPLVSRYVSYTMGRGFEDLNTSSTDLSALLHFLFYDDNRNMLKNPSANLYFFKGIRVQQSIYINLLQLYRRGRPNPSVEFSLLNRITTDLRISNSNYRSISTFACSWDSTTTYDKRLSLTRLLQAFRSRLSQSPLRTYLEQLAKEEDLELHNVNNPEYDSRGPSELEKWNAKMHQPKEKGPGLLANLAAIGLGAFFGMHRGGK